MVAHRGASHEVAEHTLQAYAQALAEGADAVECDVRLTADGHLVCVHDRTLTRTAGTSRLVSTMDLHELDRLDFHSWKNPWAGPVDRDDDGGALTLRRLLSMVADHDRRVEVAVETKHPTRYAGLVEQRLAALLADFGWTRSGAPVRVMSFSHLACRRATRLLPDLSVVQLLDTATAWQRTKRLVGPQWILGPGIDLLVRHPGLAEDMAARGHRLHVWTVNTPDHVRRCLDWGVAAIITDRPAFVADIVDAHRPGVGYKEP